MVVEAFSARNRRAVRAFTDICLTVAFDEAKSLMTRGTDLCPVVLACLPSGPDPHLACAPVCTAADNAFGVFVSVISLGAGYTHRCSVLRTVASDCRFPVRTLALLLATFVTLLVEPVVAVGAFGDIIRGTGEMSRCSGGASADILLTEMSLLEVVFVAAFAQSRPMGVALVALPRFAV